MNKIEVSIKLQIRAGEANPSPPIGPALGARGINIVKFCNQFNEKTKNIKDIKKGTILPTVINIYKDKSFDFIIKSPPASVLIKNLLNIEKGSDCPNKNKIGTVTREQLLHIVKQKNSDLIVNSDEAALNTLIGTALSMGINVEGKVNETE